MKQVRVEDAVGSILCQDITKIIPGEFKGAAFKKGHIVTAEDVPELLKLGKAHLYVWEDKAGFLHENEAGERLAKAVGAAGLSFGEPSEGKVSLLAAADGLCEVDEQLLFEINMTEGVVAATIGNCRPVKKGDVVAGVRVVPLAIEEEKIRRIEQIAKGGQAVAVRPYRSLKAGIVTTGGEIYHKRIEDKFGPVVRKKAEAYHLEVIRQIIVDDDVRQIADAVLRLRDEGAQIIFTTGGMSVDPDDLTPRGIVEAGANIVTYGAPVLPGAMLMVAYLGDIPVLGLPGCVMYHKATVFDLVLPVVLTGQRITRPMIVKLGMGGLCLQCGECRYPHCSFGSGA